MMSIRKMMIAVACATLVSATAFAEPKPGDDRDLSVLQAQQQAEAAAATAAVVALKWQFVSVCMSSAINLCPQGPNPIWFGSLNNWTYDQCNAARLAISKTMFGVWPRSLSNCVLK